MPQIRWPEWLTAIFTIVIACATVAAYKIYKGQLETARTEQRAWVLVGAGVHVFTDATKDPANKNASPGSVEFGMAVNVINKGKTQATDVRTKVVVTLIRRDEDPKFDFEDPDVINGALLIDNRLIPDESEPTGVGPLDRGTHLPYVISQSEKQLIDEGGEFPMIYARTDYADIFGHTHWEQFCTIVQINPAQFISTTKAAKACALYNDADKDNE